MDQATLRNDRAGSSHTCPSIICTDDGIFAKVILNEETEMAKIDTSAKYSYIGEEFSKKLLTLANYTSEWTTMRLANGTSIRIAVATICLGNRQCKMRLQILSNVTDRLVLGLDFLRAINAVLVLADHAITLSQQTTKTANSNDLKTKINEKIFGDNQTPLHRSELLQQQQQQHRDTIPTSPDNRSSSIKLEHLGDNERPAETNDKALPCSPVKEEIIRDDECPVGSQQQLMSTKASSSPVIEEMICDDKCTIEDRQQVLTANDMLLPIKSSVQKKDIDEDQCPEEVRQRIKDVLEKSKPGQQKRFAMIAGESRFFIRKSCRGKVQVSFRPIW